MSREYVLTHPEVKLTKSQKKRYENLIKRRQKHEPLAYILGKKEFYGLEFKVTPDTLIPRPETEMLVELALKKIEEAKSMNQEASVIDVGTGSGNIIVSIAKNINDYPLFGLDISKKALFVAKHNARKNKVYEKIKFIQSDLLEYFLKKRFKNLIIVANLPYLSKNIYEKAMPDVKNFEPKSALYSPKEGLGHYEKLFQQIKRLPAKPRRCLAATVILEISPEQKPKIKRLIEKYFPSAKIDFKRDLTGKWRIASFEIG